MKIQHIHAGVIRIPDAAGSQTQARRPAWHEGTEIANPMSRYPRYKSRRDRWRPSPEAVACLVTCADGTWGLGLTTYGAPVSAIINQHMAPLLVGEESTATEKLGDMMVRITSPYGGSGLASYAVSAVDLALWDLKGKLLKRPVYELLGGPVRDRLPCYATGNDTDWHLELGFQATKLACPYGPADGLSALEQNEALIAKTRELVGPQVELMLDCWMALDVDFAVRLAERLRPYRLRWIEDCLLPDDLEGLAELRRRLTWQPLATGEHWYSPSLFLAAASRRFADVLQPDVQWVGGVTAAVKICHLADAAGIAVIPHAGMNDAYGQHLSFAMPNVPWGELFIGSAPGVPLGTTGRRTPGMAVPKDGLLTPTDAPGFGIEMTRAEIEAAMV